MPRLLFIMAWTLAAPLIASSADKSYSCKAPADVQAGINAAGSKGFEELLLKKPDSFWIRLAFIDSKSSPAQRLKDLMASNLEASKLLKGLENALPRGNGGVPYNRLPDAAIERFHKEFESQPQDPETTYLYAYSLIHKNTAKSK